VIFKKNRFLIFLVFNGILLVLILLLSIPISKYLSKINLKDNEYVKDQIIINPEAKSTEILDRSVKIQFVAKIDKYLQWEFKPLQENIEVKIGENKIIKYSGKNLSDKTITSTANFFTSPENIQNYLIKTECFCFIEQTLKSGESKIFTMVFYIDPSIDSDKNFDDLKELVFTYEFSEYKS
tara:strand:+ start:1136 stop:1678 length:543 start_codon:yes stop_codon:yes gene_type:complete